MTQPETRKNRNLGVLEYGLYATGILLIGVFVVSKVWSENQSSQAIAAFENYRQAEAPRVGSPDGSESHDTRLWSPPRIQAYQDALKQHKDMPLAVLEIEKLDIEVPVFNGTDDLTLNRGLGRIIGTSRVGQIGNLGIAGHRDSFFRGLKDIQVGDSMVLKTFDGQNEYQVTSITITTPDDVSVLAPSDEDTITLVTCYPFYFVGHAPKRYIVKGKVVAKKSPVKASS